MASNGISFQPDQRSGYRPRIGLTTYLQRGAWGVWDEVAAILPAAYTSSVLAAGGTSLLLPPVFGDDGPDTSVLDVLDGLIVSGGVDVDPAHYGAPPHPKTSSQTERDVFDLALTDAALAAGLPLLAICRGAQILNVARGGTLHQHLPDLLPDADYQPAPGVFGSVAFETEPGTVSRQLLGERATAPVYHHQAIDVVGRGLKVTARAADGTVEAIEADGRGWNLGVQFHPEQNSADSRLFLGLVDEARKYAQARPGARYQEEVSD
ncbi:gamma-glutamyl-gamma-aminobutyrate hydrolase family protein [Arthrobacter russicus]|uniref:Gamma-glutamyl-gamma-aminobutyrate hydrolase PuuD n=1 Tax=Arthrobacter russicus TaxID=172040 RepID=A0ABU1JC15_9MICC|nr:gamma-glutamyl-gamma-aminobutyrate hydrolase family protein [Arthrobacter russicus]MDN5667893.1 gamma-glutamyl-gamma-aminobutyrate hydrolase family protein [Renibacterium salmoninarum]MDR6269908.1 gamma-glutamyl-gamma-aminobutyrate hydrolase PuuD [Arthrobacter russicus]